MIHDLSPCAFLLGQKSHAVSQISQIEATRLGETWWFFPRESCAQVSLPGFFQIFFGTL